MGMGTREHDTDSYGTAAQGFTVNDYTEKTGENRVHGSLRRGRDSYWDESIVVGL
jgi:hypothetical protein